MKSLYFFVGFSLLLFIACSEQKTKEQQQGADSALPVIDLEKALRNLTKEKFNFSNFASDITYVPLETNDRSLFGGRFAPIYNRTENYFFASNMMFNRDGSFVRKLGQIGQGPKEYVLARGMAADEKRQEFYVYDNPTQNIVIYDFNNVFKKRIKVHSYGHFIYSIGDGKLLLTRGTGYFFDDFFEYQIIDTDQERVSYTRDIGVIKDGSNEKGCSMGIDNNIIWSFGNTSSYYEFFTDTIFSLENGMIASPLYRINIGKYKYSIDVMRNTNREEYHAESFIRIGSISESSLYLFFSISYNKIFYYASYNKTTGELLMNKFDEFFNNDIDGGFLWLFNNIEGETTGQYQFLPHVGKERIENLSVINKNYDVEKNKVLRKLLSDIGEDDNAVVYFFNLK